MKEAFVYSWINKDTNRIYVGWHKGSSEDGYVCSSKVMLEEYSTNPENFERFIIAHGTAEDMAKLETAILQAVNAKNNPRYYNQHNGNGLYHLKSHTSEAREKISMSKRGKKRPDLTRRNLDNNPAKNPETAKKLGRDMENVNNPMFGKKHSPETLAKISASLKGSGLGKCRSDETKKRISEAKKAYWAKRKENS